VNEAIAHYRKALENQPEPETYNNLGLALIRKGEVDEAVTCFQKALKMTPGNEKALNSFGLVLLRKGQVDEALIYLQKAVALHPDNVDAQNNLGSALLQKGQWDQAALHFQKALELQPNFADAYCNLGFLSLREGQVKAAVAYFQAGLQLQPDNVDARKYLAWILATCPEASLRNGAEAVKLAQQANQLSGGNNPAILATLAAAQAEVGHFSDGLATAQKASVLATAQTNTAVVNALRNQIKFYQAGSPFRDSSLTNTQAATP
jgi:Tfp pilus assembly protein PilF